MEGENWRVGIRSKVDRDKAQATEVFLFDINTKEEIPLNHLLLDTTLSMSPKGTVLTGVFLFPYTFENKVPVEIIKPGQPLGKV